MLRPLSQLIGEEITPHLLKQTPVVLLRSGDDRLAISVDDVSSNQEVVVKSVGAQVAPDCAWAKVGMVIAFRRRESVEWQVALIRRLNRSPNGPLNIGMARLGGKVRSARLRRGIGSIDYVKSNTEIEYDAISLREATLSLLLPVGVFDNTQKYTLTCEDKQHVVKMEKSLERRHCQVIAGPSGSPLLACQATIDSR